MLPDDVKERLLKNPKTSAVGSVLVVVGGVSASLLGGPFDAYAKIAMAAVGLAAAVALLFAKD